MAGHNRCGRSRSEAEGGGRDGESQSLASPGEMEKEDLFKLAQSTSGAVPCCLPRHAVSFVSFCLAGHSVLWGVPSTASLWSREKARLRLRARACM